MKKKLVAILACRNNSSRLYAKPLQFLDIDKKVTVIDHIIKNLKKIKIINEIVLAIADSKENIIYENVAKKNGVRFFYGSENNVVKRMLDCARYTNATDIFRVTSESPFLFNEMVTSIWLEYKKEKFDAAFLDNVIDGCGFEIFNLDSLKQSFIHSKKDYKEFVTKHIRKNNKKFKILKFIPHKKFFRRDLRLTIDYPEDLIVCREVYKQRKLRDKKFKIEEIIKFLDSRPELKKLIGKYCSAGYKTMYL